MPPATEHDMVTILSELDDGNVHEQLCRRLADVVRAVEETSKSGALTLKLRIKPEGRTFIVEAEIKATIPQPKSLGSLYFAKDGSLYREDPRQQSLNLTPPVRLPTPVQE